MASILPMFILFFASSALVPVSTMPGGLQPFAQNQPATVTINAVRALFEGGPSTTTYGRRPCGAPESWSSPGHLTESLQESHSLTEIAANLPLAG
jgi:hypothetical protein